MNENFAVPDVRVKIKENENLEKYLELDREKQSGLCMCH